MRQEREQTMRGPGVTPRLALGELLTSPWGGVWGTDRKRESSIGVHLSLSTFSFQKTFLPPPGQNWSCFPSVHTVLCLIPVTTITLKLSRLSPCQTMGRDGSVLSFFYFTVSSPSSAQGRLSSTVSLKKKNWSIVDLQCCVSLRCIAKWVSL